MRFQPGKKNGQLKLHSDHKNAAMELRIHRFVSQKNVIANIPSRTKRGDRILAGIKDILFPLLLTFQGVICAVSIVKNKSRRLKESGVPLVLAKKIICQPSLSSTICLIALTTLGITCTLLPVAKSSHEG